MKKFLDCISIVGATPSKFHGTKKYVSTGAVATTEIDESEVVEVTYEDRPSRANLSAEAGDILFAKMQGTRKTLLLDSETEENIYSTGFYAVRANPEVITTECLYYLIDSELFLAQKDKNCSGATQKAITNGGMAKIEISVPALSEQGILVDKLKHLTQLIADKKKQLNLFDEIIKSRFIELFGDSEHNTRNWPTAKLSSLCYVGSSKRIYQSELTDNGIPFLRISDLNERIDGKDNAPQLFISTEKFDELRSNRLIPLAGDVLVTTRGTLGRCYIIKESDSFYFQDGMISWLSNICDSITSLYVSELFATAGVQKQIANLQAGSTVAYLSIAMLKKLDIMLPPLALQNQFAAFVEQVDKSKFEIQQSLEKLEILKKSLMQQYFG